MRNDKILGNIVGGKYELFFFNQTISRQKTENKIKDESEKATLMAPYVVGKCTIKKYFQNFLNPFPSSTDYQ